MVLERPHGACLRRSRVIHPGQMQDAVDQQVPQLGPQGNLTGTSLSGRTIERDHDVAKAGSPEGGIGAIQHGEGQHVGRAARAPETAG